MALFDFVKKLRKRDKDESKKGSAKKQRAHKHDHAHDEHEEHETHEKLLAPAAIVGLERSVIIAPHVTERARDAANMKRYTFRVTEDATKYAVKQNIERAYGVHVEGVNIVQIPSKPRRRGLTKGVKKGYKKAVVALREGEAIDIF